jgi:hypothetical protein
MYNELERIWKVIMVSCEVILQDVPGANENEHKMSMCF